MNEYASAPHQRFPPDMPERAAALAAFYGGPVWAKHRDAANATMLDSDDVLLLRPADAGFPVPGVGGQRIRLRPTRRSLLR